MSWLARIPIIGRLFDLGGDITHRVKRARLEKLDRDNPIHVVDEVLGTFFYVRELNWFEQKRAWDSAQITLTLDGEWDSPEAIDDDAAELAIAARTFWEDEPGWLDRLKKCAARDMLGLAQEWAADAGRILTEEEFLAAINPQSIGVSPEGGFDVWFTDGEVFAGHGILVMGTIKGGPEVAEMHG